MEIVNSDKSLKDVISLIEQTQKEFGYIEVEITVKGKARTNPQNAALHLWLKQLSYHLNESGWDMKKTLAHHAEIPWDKKGRNAKEKLFKPILEDMTGKDSTAKADRVQYNEVYEVLARYFANQGLIVPPWPSRV
jgi:hypothetical protein